MNLAQVVTFSCTLHMERANELAAAFQRQLLSIHLHTDFCSSSSSDVYRWRSSGYIAIIMVNMVW
jgi:hypothetical protein